MMKPVINTLSQFSLWSLMMMVMMNVSSKVQFASYTESDSELVSKVVIGIQMMNFYELDANWRQLSSQYVVL